MKSPYTFVIVIFSAALDFLKGSFTCYYGEKSLLEKDFKKIWKRYKKTTLKYDLLALIPIIVNRAIFFDHFDKTDVNIVKICEFFILFKIHILVTILNNFSLTYGRLEKHENKINLIKIILIIILNAHVLAILLFTVSFIEMKYIKSGNETFI